MANSEDKNNKQSAPKDGFDNTGTQGYDSLSDDAYTGAAVPFVQPDNEANIDIPFTIKSAENNGEKIIFDLSIREKLAHVIVLKNRSNYHVNLDGEDLGRFVKGDDGNINRFAQSKGVSNDVDDYFDAIERKLKELGK